MVGEREKTMHALYDLEINFFEENFELERHYSTPLQMNVPYSLRTHFVPSHWPNYTELETPRC